MGRIFTGSGRISRVSIQSSRVQAIRLNNVLLYDGQVGGTSGGLQRQVFSAPATAYLALVEAEDDEPLENIIYNLLGTCAEAVIPLGGTFVPNCGPRTLAAARIPMVGTAGTYENITEADYNRRRVVLNGAQVKRINPSVRTDDLSQNDMRFAVYAVGPPVGSAHGALFGTELLAAATSTIAELAFEATAAGVPTIRGMGNRTSTFTGPLSGLSGIYRNASGSYSIKVGDNDAVVISGTPGNSLAPGAGLPIGIGRRGDSESLSFRYTGDVGPYTFGPYADPEVITPAAHALIDGVNAYLDDPNNPNFDEPTPEPVGPPDPGPAPDPDPDPTPPPAPDPTPPSVGDPVTQVEYDNRVDQLATLGPTSAYILRSGSEYARDNLATLTGRLLLNPNSAPELDRVANWFSLAPVDGNEEMFNYYVIGFLANKYWTQLGATRQNILRDDVVRIRDWLNLGTPNHQIMRLVGGALLGQLWPTDTVFGIGGATGQTGNQVIAAVKPRLIGAARNLLLRGDSEHLSGTYAGFHIGPWAALLTESNDPELVRAAEAALSYHVASAASHHVYGAVICGPNRRENVADRHIYSTAGGAHPWVTALSRCAWLWWGDNTRGRTGLWDAARIGPTAFILASSGWRPDPALNWLAVSAQQTPMTTVGSLTEQAHAGALVRSDSAYETSTLPAYRVPHPYDNFPGYRNYTCYREERFAVGSQWHQFDPDGFHDQGSATSFVYNSPGLGGNQRMDLTHSYWRMGSFGGGGEFLGSESPFLSTSQYQNTVIALANIPTNDPWATRGRLDWQRKRRNPLLNDIRFRYPNARTDQIAASGWFFIQHGQILTAVRPLTAGTVLRGSVLARGATYANNSDFDLIRCFGPITGMVIDIATTAEYATLALFRDAVLAQPFSFSVSGNAAATYTSVRGHTLSATRPTINFAYSWAPTLANPTPPAPGRITVRNTFSVNGVIQQPDMTFPALVNPYVDCRDYLMNVNTPAGAFVVDARAGVPVITRP